MSHRARLRKKQNRIINRILRDKTSEIVKFYTPERIQRLVGYELQEGIGYWGGYFYGIGAPSSPIKFSMHGTSPDAFIIDEVQS